MAKLVMVVRPTRPAQRPASKLPNPPRLIAANATALAQAGLSPAWAKLPARKSGSHVRMAYKNAQAAAHLAEHCARQEQGNARL